MSTRSVGPATWRALLVLVTRPHRERRRGADSRSQTDVQLVGGRYFARRGLAGLRGRRVTGLDLPHPP